MKMKNLMKPWDGEVIFCEGLEENEELYSLDTERLAALGELVPIVSKEGRKLGEIKQKVLLSVRAVSDASLAAQIMDQFEEGIVAVSTDGTIFYANEMYSKTLGVPIGKIIGRSMYQIEPGAALLEVLKTRKPAAIKQQYIRTIDKYVACRMEPIYLEGELKGAVSVFSDATEVVKLNQEIQRANQVAINLQQQVNAKDEFLRLKLVGKSPAFLKLISQAEIVAKTDAPVMIRGENGTGKELIAKFIHQNSGRADKPLIIVNCASIPESLVESELFGYEEGSFTGARQGGKMGKFEMADGGTLFLDEIGDMPVTMQTKLLRAIQENEIEKIGREKNIAVNVRIITATNQPLEQMIEEKTFRQDLYYRINTVSLRVPALRERREDILLLTDHFVREYSVKYRKNISMSEEVLGWFYRHDWPGNVRELQNCIENGVIMCQSEKLDMSSFAQYLQEETAAEGRETDIGMMSTESEAGADLRGEVSLLGGFRKDETLKDALFRAEGVILRGALQTCKQNRTEAMELLGLSRRTFYRKLQEHGMTGHRNE